MGIWRETIFPEWGVLVEVAVVSVTCPKHYLGIAYPDTYLSQGVNLWLPPKPRCVVIEQKFQLIAEVLPSPPDIPPSPHEARFTDRIRYPEVYHVHIVRGFVCGWPRVIDRHCSVMEDFIYRHRAQK